MQDCAMARADKFNFRYKNSDSSRNAAVLMNTTPSASVPPILPLHSVLWLYLLRKSIILPTALSLSKPTTTQEMRFQHLDEPCGHASAGIQGYDNPAGSLYHSVRDFIAYN